MTTTLNDSTSELGESKQNTFLIEKDEQAEKGTYLRNVQFQVRRRRMTHFILSMVLSGFEIGYTI